MAFGLPRTDGVDGVASMASSLDAIHAPVGQHDDAPTSRDALDDIDAMRA